LITNVDNTQQSMFDLCLIKIWLHAFLTAALDSGEWSAWRPGCFTTRKEFPLRIG